MRYARHIFEIGTFGAFTFPLMAGSGTAAETLRMGGTGSASEMLRQVGAEFTVATGVKIDVVPNPAHRAEAVA